MKKSLHLVLSLLLCSLTLCTYADTGSITVGGDFDKYYPVTWTDGGWGYNIASELELGRSNVHVNSDWRGSLIAKFRYHVSAYGNGSSFIDADIKSSQTNFVAGWRDASTNGLSQNIIIWLKGGGTTYYYQSNYPVTAVAYDVVQNALPYQENNGPAHTYRTTIDPYVNVYGTSITGTANFNGGGINYFAGNVGIGVVNPGSYQLAVNGSIHSKQVNVDLNGWADYVFKKNYTLMPLAKIKTYIDENHHLPDMPSEQEVAEKGLNLGEMNKILTKKVEELTLYAIEQQKQIEQLKQQQEARIAALEKALSKLTVNQDKQ